MASCIPAEKSASAGPTAIPPTGLPTNTAIVIALPPQWTKTFTPLKTKVVPTAILTKTKTTTPVPTEVPNMAPDFSAATLDGGLFHLYDHLGSPVVLFFARSQCPYCRAMTPSMVSAHQQFPKISMVLIDAEDGPAGTQAFMKNYKIFFLGIADTSTLVSGRYQISAVPTTVFINSFGSMVKRLNGEETGDQLNSYFKNLQ